MAELSVSADHTHQRRGRRSKKLSTRVDLTPMVDLGFLLITFFIFTTTMSSPKMLRLIMPADGPSSEVATSAALTVIPIAGNSIFYYNGELSEALRTGSYGTTGYGRRGGIGDIIREKQQALDRYFKRGRKEMMLLIKPAPESTYQNLISLLDETSINAIGHYALMDLTPEEANKAKNTR